MTDEEDFYYNISLGDDYDCETCGYTWNELRFEEWDPDDKTYILQMSVGCYGGASAISSEEDFTKQVDDIIESAHRYPGFNDELEAELRNLIKEKIG